MKAWYFSQDNCRLRYGDDSIIKAGKTHKVNCKPILCEQGLHGSVDIRDALDYAPAAYIWRVELGGEIVKGDDKAVATHRTYLWGYNATDVLWHCARLNALDVADNWDMPDVVRRFLMTGDEDLRSAANSAAYSAYSADSAAYSAYSAADSADSANSAAYSGACSGAYSAIRAKQSRRLYRMIMDSRP